MADAEAIPPLSLVAAVLTTGGGRTLVGVRRGLSGSCATGPTSGTGREGWDRSAGTGREGWDGSGTVESLCLIFVS